MSPLRHRLAGSRTDGQLAWRPPCGDRLALTRATETVALLHLAELQDADRDAFHRVAIDQGLPRPPSRTRHLVWKLRATRAPFSPRGRRRVRQHAVRRAPGPAPRRRLAFRLLERRDARCVGPVSAISRFRTSTRASPAPEWSNAFAPANRRSRLLHGRTSRFGGSHVAPLRDFTASGVVFPTRRVVTGPLNTSVASRPEPVELALLTLSNRPPRSPQLARVNDANRRTIRGAFH
jgi:hypothetical protein